MSLRPSRSMALLAALMLTGCAPAIIGFHEITDYRAKYGAETKDIHLHDIHGKAIMAGLRSPQERPERTSSPKCSVALTMSGGGSISAAFAYGVLREMAEWDKVQVAGVPTSLLSQVDYISTASGGGITGAILAGVFWEKEVVNALDATPFSPDSFHQSLKRHFDSKDYKATFSERYLGNNEFLFTNGQERLRRFRKRLPIGVFGLNYQDKDCDSALTFDDMFSREQPVAQEDRPGEEKQLYARARSYAPAWIPNATSFADGTRVPLTSAVMGKLQVVGISHQELLCEAKPDTFAEWPMSEALAASMSFPGIGPYRMKSRLGQLDLVDGGLADNLGVFTALDVVRADMEPSLRRAERGLIIVIDSSTDAQAGMFVSESVKVPESEYLLEYGKTELFAQYPVAAEALEAAQPGIAHVFVRARDFRTSTDMMETCTGLLPESDKIPGASGCPAGSTPQSMKVGEYVRDQRTSAAITYAHADGLMQLGRMAAKQARCDILTKLQHCIAGSDEPAPPACP